MQKTDNGRPRVPPSFFGKLMLPFAVPALLTLILVLTVGERWPRNIAPGSGLKFAGLVMTVVTCAVVWRLMVLGTGDDRIRKFAAVACAVTGLMGWPVWSAGVLLSVNGVLVGPATTTHMIFERTQMTRNKKSVYHWAWLKAESDESPIASGRYFIPEATFIGWSIRPPDGVEVRVARGLLGAQVVMGYSSHPDSRGFALILPPSEQRPDYRKHVVDQPAR